MVKANYSRTLTADEFLAQLRQQRAMEPVGDGFSRVDSPGAIRHMARHARMLYEEALLTLDPASIPLTDRSDSPSLTPAPDGSHTILRLPADCLRVVEIRLAGWARSAKIVGAGSPEAAAQCQEFSRAGSEQPVAVAEHGGLLRLYPAGGPAECLLCAVIPPDNIYIFTPEVENYIFKHYST